MCYSLQWTTPHFCGGFLLKTTTIGFSHTPKPSPMTSGHHTSWNSDMKDNYSLVSRGVNDFFHRLSTSPSYVQKAPKCVSVVRNPEREGDKEKQTKKKRERKRKRETNRETDRYENKPKPSEASYLDGLTDFSLIHMFQNPQSV